jgi:hypothetical protein
MPSLAARYNGDWVQSIEVISPRPKETFAQTVRDILDHAAPAVVYSRTGEGESLV